MKAHYRSERGAKPAVDGSSARSHRRLLEHWELTGNATPTHLHRILTRLGEQVWHRLRSGYSALGAEYLAQGTPSAFGTDYHCPRCRGVDMGLKHVLESCTDPPTLDRMKALGCRAHGGASSAVRKAPAEVLTALCEAGWLEHDVKDLVRPKQLTPPGTATAQGSASATVLPSSGPAPPASAAARSPTVHAGPPTKPSVALVEDTCARLVAFVREGTACLRTALAGAERLYTAETGRLWHAWRQQAGDAEDAEASRLADAFGRGPRWQEMRRRNAHRIAAAAAERDAASRARSLSFAMLDRQSPPQLDPPQDSESEVPSSSSSPSLRYETPSPSRRSSSSPCSSSRSGAATPPDLPSC